MRLALPSKLRPFFGYYGGKWRIAPRYPAPEHETIIEPFAGSAGYSLRYPDRRVILVDRDPVVVGTWRYLLRASEAEILALPDLAPGQSVDDFPICQEARWLIGWHCGWGQAIPGTRLSAGMIKHFTGGYGKPPSPCRCWGAPMRERIASQLPTIRHWQVIEGDYTDAPDIPATWHIDPPYQDAGRRYRHGSRAIDFQDLAAWCRTRQGQVMACENTGADWLPFRHFVDARSCRGISREAIWTPEPTVTILTGERAA